MWQEWVTAVLGLCVIAVAFLGLTGMTLAWTLVILGAVIAIVGFWGASVLSEGESATKHGHA